jgi:hypothetical protein
MERQYTPVLVDRVWAFHSLTIIPLLTTTFAASVALNGYSVSMAFGDKLFLKASLILFCR